MSHSPGLFPGCLCATPGFPVSGGLLGLSGCCRLVAEQATSQPASQPSIHLASCHVSTRFVLLFMLERKFCREPQLFFFPFCNRILRTSSLDGNCLMVVYGSRNEESLGAISDTLRVVGWVQWRAQCCRWRLHLVIACCCSPSEGQGGFCVVV